MAVLLSPLVMAAPPGDGAWSRRLVQDGMVIEARIEPVLRPADGVLREGDRVRVRFSFRDERSGEPLSRLYPAAWLDFLPEGDRSEGAPQACRSKISSYVGGALLAYPELNLNVYYVLALNHDATISVVDPLFGFGGSKLLEMVVLPAPAEDWVLDPRRDRLYASMPEHGSVAVVDTARWKIETVVPVGPRPGRLLLQGDGRLLWVAHGGVELDAPSGVTALDLEDLRIRVRVETGAGEHDLALADRDRLLYVSNRRAGTVTVIETRSGAVVRQVPVGPEPRWLGASDLAGVVFASLPDSGVIAVLDVARHEVAGRLEAGAGVGPVRVSPDGRIGLAVNPRRDELYVIDTARRQVVQTADVEDQPVEVGFSTELAYVLHGGSETVLMVPLSQLGREGEPVPVIDFPGGERPPGRGARGVRAAKLVEAPGATAVLVANPEDRAIYYYKEGMAAPMGHFKNYGRQPLAVEVVDRSLREVAPGDYETTAELRRAGRYDLALFVNAPQVTDCFELEVLPAPAAQDRGSPARVRYLVASSSVTVGEEVAVRFRLEGAPAGPAEAEVLTFLAPGVWQMRHRARAGADGVYEVRFVPPRRGVYYVFVQAPAAGVSYRGSGYLVLTAEDGGVAPPGAEQPVPGR
jgi:YVTN family beta-propeller protein